MCLFECVLVTGVALLVLIWSPSDIAGQSDIRHVTNIGSCVSVSGMEPLFT